MLGVWQVAASTSTSLRPRASMPFVCSDARHAGLIHAALCLARSFCLSGCLCCPVQRLQRCFCSPASTGGNGNLCVVALLASLTLAVWCVPKCPCVPTSMCLCLCCCFWGLCLCLCVLRKQSRPPCCMCTAGPSRSVLLHVRSGWSVTCCCQRAVRAPGSHRDQLRTADSEAAKHVPRHTSCDDWPSATSRQRQVPEERRSRTSIRAFLAPVASLTATCSLHLHSCALVRGCTLGVDSTSTTWGLRTRTWRIGSVHGVRRWKKPERRKSKSRRRGDD